MTEVRFYHLTRTSLEAALPQMLEKTLERGQRAVVLAGSPERVEALNAWLWTYRENSFLPHGSARDGFAAEQPVWLSERDENPNQAEALFLTDGAVSGRVGDYKLCVVLFDGTSEAAVSAARAQWRGLKEAGHDCTY
ncbi:MAG: DNA polymerase III subunit chi, partial [Kiloniellales bacterium]